MFEKQEEMESDEDYKELVDKIMGLPEAFVDNQLNDIFRSANKNYLLEYEYYLQEKAHREKGDDFIRLDEGSNKLAEMIN